VVTDRRRRRPDRLRPVAARKGAACQQKKAAGIVDDVLNNANRANGQQPANGPDRNQRIGGAWMTVNGVLTCVPSRATFRNNERVESVLPPNGDPRC
jgi:hypothetical protein